LENFLIGAANANIATQEKIPPKWINTMPSLVGRLKERQRGK
jgi:hypothetical protein